MLHITGFSLVIGLALAAFGCSFVGYGIASKKLGICIAGVFLSLWGVLQFEISSADCVPRKPAPATITKPAATNLAAASFYYCGALQI